ncbi:hypothetical protein NFI96_003212 [Prochilodus magdalenae]|nr:hypothetical protein NFI96_003212 [Prochilodus magdalenae]
MYSVKHVHPTAFLRHQDLRLVLLGKVGAGKSASGNTLLGTPSFSSRLSASLVTQGCEAQTVTLGGRRIMVVDTPGLTARMVAGTVKDTLLHCLQLSAPGPHAFLLVIRLGRFTQEERDAVERVVKVFGTRLYMFTIILFTFKDRLKGTSIEEYISSAGDSLQQLVRKCGNRYHVFNNSRPGEEDQVEQLLVKLENLVAANGGRWYTDTDLVARPKLHHLVDSSYGIGHSLGATAQDANSKMSEYGFKDEDLEIKILDLLSRLNLSQFYPQKLTTGGALTMSRTAFQTMHLQTEKDMVSVFLYKLFTMDSKSRYVTCSKEICMETWSEDFDDFLNDENDECDDSEDGNSQIHPMDVQMAVFHCADSFLRQNMVTKLSSCQYALPLLVPSPTICPDIDSLSGRFGQIKKTWKSAGLWSSTSKSQLLNYLINPKHDTFFHRDSPGSSRTRLFMEGLMEIAWLGCLFPTSKSQLLNSLINPKHDTFFHRDSPGSSRTRLFMEGLVEIVWYCPAGNTDDLFTPTFCLEESSDLSKHFGFRVDEDSEDCQEGKTGALEVMELLKREDISQIKTKLLPCQGKLWQEWSSKNKQLYRLYGDVEQTKSKIQQEMKLIRNQQRETSLDFIKAVCKNLNSKHNTKKAYFVRWLGFYLDVSFLEELSEVTQQYYKQLSDVHSFKQRREITDDFRKKEEELQTLSEKVDAVTLGLEHIMREMGQIYEAWAERPGEMPAEVSALPAVVADLLISGHPLELMDGDAAHVPLTWIESVLDKVSGTLGDQRVFVLSVLGLRSSGKSTMLNAMFGLQFAVRAGRCTRGAFIQLIRVKEEEKEELRFDYLLVVDTGGLQSLQLVGKRSGLTHDNELATFVTGLADLTLINIFGENPAEIKDILQIVVQAFLRMKEVNLNPSCMFVHQNVPDISAGEKNMEGRRRLQDKLDEMTRLAAAEEVCSAECFTDVIKFNIQTDVHYFAQLWEGNPPMTPPNPRYSEHVEKLKRAVLTAAAGKKCLRLSELKARIGDLWTAVLSEDFVFYFKNSLEISEYRRLEVMYWDWTWELREKIIFIQNKLQNRIEHGKLEAVDQKLISEEINPTFTAVQTCKELDVRKTQYENELFNRSKDLASRLKDKAMNEQSLRGEFDSIDRKLYKQINNRREYSEELVQETEIVNRVKKRVEEFKSERFRLKNEFTVDLSLFVCDIAKGEFFSIFKKQCEGATATTVFTDFICNKLKPSILQSVYDQTAIDAAGEMRANYPAFNGNRSNLEKHILRDLAEDENFERFITYIQNPKKHFSDFIHTKFKHEMLEAIQKATQETERNRGGVHEWLEKFSLELQIRMDMFRQGPEDILIEQLCGCWVQCPFCAAICTNTMEGHDGDHSVPFHRPGGVNGKKYREAGPEYACWSITPDSSEQAYWKWFVCRFQNKLEKFYGMALAYSMQSEE